MSDVVNKSDESVRRMFGEIAPNYDRLNHLLSCNIDRYWRTLVADRLPLAPGDRVLDVCTGTADLALAIWRTTRGECPIVGTDFCPEMLEFGRRKIGKLGIGEDVLQLTEADAQQLPFDDESFQAVTVAFGLRNVADSRIGLREMVRVCRRGGTVAILEFSMPRRQPIKGLYRMYFRHALPLIGRWINRNRSRAYHYLPASVEQFPAYEALAGWLEEEKLREVRIEPLTFGIATLYTGVK